MAVKSYVAYLSTYLVTPNDNKTHKYIQDDPDPRPFQEEVNNCIGRSVTFGVWSAKGQTLRQITIPIPASDPSLGVSLKWAPLSDAENVWHILDVIPHSPAYQGGLLPYSDYIVGTPFGKLRGESGLGELVEDVSLSCLLCFR